MQVSAEASGDEHKEPGAGQLGARHPRSQEVGPDRYWRRPGFAAKYCRNFVDALQAHSYFARYHFQCQMALAQGIAYLCEKPDRILDAGCGHGMRAVEMQMKYFPESTLIGCDYSEPMIKNASLIMSNLPPDKRVRCEEANVYNLPYGDATFDVVYCYGLLMSLEELELGLNELMRVSTHGLVAIEETPDVMDSIQLRYWSDYKDKRFPGRTYWHNYLKHMSNYGTVIFNKMGTDVWELEPDSPENHKVPPGYARFIVAK